MAGGTASTINQRIALVGGDDILNQLKELGSAGQQAFDQLSGAIADANKLLEKTPEEAAAASKAINDTSEAAHAFGASLREVGSALGNTLTSLAKVVGAITGAVGLRAAYQFLTTGSASVAKAANEQAQALGLAVEKYTALQFALQQTGVSETQAQQALTTLNLTIAKTKEGATKGGTALDKLGISVNGFNGDTKDAAQVLSEIADKFVDLPEGAAKSALAVQLFGRRSGPELVALLNQGSAGIEKFTQRAEALGLTTSKAEVETAKALSISISTMTGIINNLLDRIGQSFAPLLTRAADAVTEFIAANQKAILDFFNGVASVVTSIVDNILIPAFNLLVSILDTVASSINAIFDTKFTGQQVGIVLITFQIIKAFTLLISSISALSTGFKLLFTVFTSASGLSTVIAGFTSLSGVITGVLGVLSSVPIAWTAIAIAAGIAIGVLLKLAVQLLQDYGPALWTAISDAATTAATTIVDAYHAVGDFFGNLGDTLRDSLNAVWDFINKAADATAQAMSDAFNTAIDNILGFFEGLLARATAIFNSITSFLSSIIDSAKQAAAAVAAAAGGADSAPGFSGGGHIRGAGTGTSDSILARVSNGEFIMQAAAVRKFGADFMHMLNRGVMPQFSMGGLVDGLANAFSFPAFADGGDVAVPAHAGGRPVHLHFPSGESFQVMAPEDVASKLISFATGQKAVRAGRSPRWRG